MSNILVEYERGMPTVTMLRDQFQAFQQEYDCKFTFINTFLVKSEDIECNDIIISVRGSTNVSVEIANMAKAAGCMHIAFYDDDLLNMPLVFPGDTQRVKNIRKLLSLTDVILTPNINLAKKYAAQIKSKRYVLIDTAVKGNEIIAPHEPGIGKIKLIYAANKMHVELFNSYILPIMPGLCERFADRISMTFIGVRPDLSRYRDRMEINYVESMPLEEYRRYVSEGRYDIGIAPLNNDEFCRNKYFNKFIEYTMSGMVGVYSRCEPYTFIVVDHINGFLTENSELGWLETLTEAINNVQLRQTCIANAQKILIEEFNQSKLFARLSQDMPEFTKYKAPLDKRVPSLFFANFTYSCSRLIEISTKIIYYYKQSGLRGLIKQTREHLIESRKNI